MKTKPNRDRLCERCGKKLLSPDLEPGPLCSVCAVEDIECLLRHVSAKKHLDNPRDEKEGA